MKHYLCLLCVLSLLLLAACGLQTAEEPPEPEGSLRLETLAVTVSVGSSPAAIAQAVSEGGVDLAFLPAEDFAALENAPRLLLTAGEGEEPGAMAVIVRPEDEALSAEVFAEALAAAVNELREDQPVFGPHDYAAAEPEAAE